jgi:pPIWI RE three-gene island domain Z
MREQPANFIPALRAQWIACVMHDLLGMDRLSAAPALLSGFRSVTDHPALREARHAIRNLRLIGVNIESDAHLQEAVTEARAWEEDHRSDDDYAEPPFEISTDPSTGFAVRGRVPKTDLRRKAMLAVLSGVLPYAEESRTAADPTRSFRFKIDGDNGSDVICDTRPVVGLPPAPTVASDKPTRAPISVRLSDLEDIARILDAEDAADKSRSPRNFYTRLRSFEGDPVFSVLSPQGGRLQPTSTISLDGLSHMIGLPGAGKSTLIFLLVVFLSRQGRRITLLVPSIEFALALDADLVRYGVPTALLVGQSPDARRRHATRLAERIATMDGGSFGQTAAGADLLGTRCALSGFVSVPPPAFEFPHDRPPCVSLRQAAVKKNGEEGREGYRLCPLATSCGRQRSARRLADADALVHIGHVISTDVGVSPHFHDERMRHFERIARTSDLVIVDEVDGAQAALDDKGIAELDLFGSTDSYESLLLQDVFDPVASGRGFALSASIENYFLASNRFMRLNRALRAHLLQRMEEEGGLLARFKDSFVTGNSILASMYLDPDVDEEDHGSSRFDHIRRFFERLVMSVLTSEIGGDGEDDLSGLDLERVARELSLPLVELEAAVARFRAALAKLLNARLVERFEENHDEMRDAFFGVIPPRTGLDDQEARVLFRFLIEVTTVVLQFLALVPAQYAMIAEGVHTERIFGQGVSADLRRLLPESLIGRLSGIRFGYETNDRGQRSSIFLSRAFRGCFSNICTR